MHITNRTRLTAAILSALGGTAQAAIITVNSALDDGSGCTLREAIGALNAGMDQDGCTAVGAYGTDDAVNFDMGLAGSVISLNGTDIDINVPMAIDGPPGVYADQLRISGNNTSRIFTINALPPLERVQIDDLHLTAGNAGAADGGAINAVANLMLVNSTISGSSNTQAGGAIAIQDGDLTLIASTITNNRAEGSGGGIHAYNSNVSLHNSTCSGNIAGLNGGCLETVQSNVTLTHTTATGNTAVGYGGAAYLYAADGAFTMTMNSSIVSANTGTGFTPNLVGAANFLSASLDFLGSFNVLGANLGFVTGTDNILTNAPGLAPLADNGGPSPTHALLPASPALDAANIADCSDGIINFLDQRGRTRPFDANQIPNNPQPNDCDIGAYEAQPEDLITQPVPTLGALALALLGGLLGLLGWRRRRG